MANTLTAILPSIYAGLDLVSREMVGIIPAMQRDVNMERAAVGQVVTVPVVPPATTGNITPGSVPPDDGDVVIGNKQVAITKSKYSPVRWNGEEQLAIGPTGQYNKILADQFAQSMRVLANEIESDAVVAGARAASRAYGMAGTTPFGTAGDFTDFAGVNQILDDNGAPMVDRRLVINSASRFNLEGKQSVLFKANEAGTDDFLRRRTLAEVMGFGIGISAGARQMVKGTGTGYLVNNAGGYPAGTRVITVDTGSGTINAGDVVTFAGDPNKYVVASLTGTTLTLNGAGLRQAAADNTAITVGNSYFPNIAFTPNAIVLAARAPALPVINGVAQDSAEDRMTVVDPASGISFEVSLYTEYRRVRFEVALAWGIGVVKEDHIGLLLG